MKKLLLLTLLALPACDFDNPFSDESEGLVSPGPPPPPPTAEDFKFNVSIHVSLVSVTPGVQSFYNVLCGPEEHSSCGNEDCEYRVNVDGVSRGEGITETFSLALASRPDDDYELRCLHAPTNSESGPAYVVVQ